jgi:hypothetical protein
MRNALLKSAILTLMLLGLPLAGASCSPIPVHFPMA